MKKTSLFPVLSLLPLLSAAQREPLPNVIVLMADDLGYGDLSCYGATRVQTPAVDSLAREGILFSNAHACASTSTPSRYGFLTGEFPFRRKGTDVAAGNAGMIIRPEQYTMADMFREKGYRTGAIGKWHLGLGSETARQDWNGQLDVHLKDIGFDYSYIMAATADRVPCVFIENGRVANFDAAAPIEVSYRQNFDGEPTARSHPQLVTKLKSSHGHDMSIVNGIGRIGYMRGGGKALWKDEDIADSILAHAVRFIRESTADTASRRPFFLYLCTNDVHVPRYPHERFRGKSPMGLRGEAILQFDWTVGQLMRLLREEGLEENTLILLTSDNGPVLDDGYADLSEELAGSHRPGGKMRGGKYSAFEAGSTIPMIVYWKNHTPKGERSPALVALTDAFRTFATLIGKDLPRSVAPDSRNYLSTWTGQNLRSAPFVVSMAANRSLMVRTEKWKYIEPSAGAPMISWGPKIESGYSSHPQLYRIDTDAAESENVADKYPRRLRKMQKLLQQVRGK